MPRFVTERDNIFFKSINEELLDDVVETLVTLYKISAYDTPANIYGESTKKIFYVGVEVAAMIAREQTAPVSYGFGSDTTQTAIFRFLRTTLEAKEVYPEVGDFILFNSGYYEIDNANEEQLVGGQPVYNHSIICATHLTRKSTINIEERPV